MTSSARQLRVQRNIARHQACMKLDSALKNRDLAKIKEIVRTEIIEPTRKQAGVWSRHVAKCDKIWFTLDLFEALSSIINISKIYHGCIKDMLENEEYKTFEEWPEQYAFRLAHEEWFPELMRKSPLQVQIKGLKFYSPDINNPVYIYPLVFTKENIHHFRNTCPFGTNNIPYDLLSNEEKIERAFDQPYYLSYVIKHEPELLYETKNEITTEHIAVAMRCQNQKILNKFCLEYIESKGFDVKSTGDFVFDYIIRTYPDHPNVLKMLKQSLHIGMRRSIYTSNRDYIKRGLKHPLIAREFLLFNKGQGRVENHVTCYGPSYFFPSMDMDDAVLFGSALKVLKGIETTYLKYVSSQCLPLYDDYLKQMQKCLSEEDIPEDVSRFIFTEFITQ